MDRQSLEAFKIQLKDFEKRLLQKEEAFAAGQDLKIHPDDDLGKAREVFENIMRQIATEDFDKQWDEKKQTLWDKMTSLLNLVSE